MLKNIALACAALSLTAAPLAAQQTASKTSTTPAKEESNLGGLSGPNMLFYLGIAVVAASILLLSENDDPVSA